MEKIGQYIDSNKQRYQDELVEILKIPSISSSPDHADAMIEMANHLKIELERIDLDAVEVIPTDGHPVVYAEWLKAPGKPTLMIYGHYDVQPVDPVDLWDSPPFDPVIKGNKIFARGSADDKGQFYIHVKAVEAWLSQVGELPINVKFVLEGEEEVGSAHLGDFIAKYKDKIQADYVVISDTAMFREGHPGITYGLRGLTYLQIDVTATDTDLHSGSIGGVTLNPINALVQMLAQVKDEHNRIQVPGFYDDVIDVSADEREKLGKLPFNEDDFAGSIGAKALTGEAGYTHLERLWARPTFDINGIWGGYQGPGAKTVIPAEAHAKVSMRLVANQEPDKIAGLFQDYMASIAPPEVNVEVTNMHGGYGYITDLNNPGLKAAIRAMEKAFGQEADYIREGGSIPIVKSFADALHAPVLLLGFGLPDQNAHAPNENFSLDNYHLGIQSIAAFFEEMGKL